MQYEKAAEAACDIESRHPSFMLLCDVESFFIGFIFGMAGSDRDINGDNPQH